MLVGGLSVLGFFFADMIIESELKKLFIRVDRLWKNILGDKNSFEKLLILMDKKTSKIQAKSQEDMNNYSGVYKPGEFKPTSFLKNIFQLQTSLHVDISVPVSTEKHAEEIEVLFFFSDSPSPSLGSN